MSTRTDHQRGIELLEDRCTPSVQSTLDALLVQDEQQVRNFLGTDLMTLGGPGDLPDLFVPGGDIQKLALKGYAPGHNLVAFEGIGLAFGRVEALSHDYVPELGVPTVLFYRPTVNISATDIIPDVPYEFIGWAYAFDYDPQSFALGPSTPGSTADQVTKFMANFPADTWQVHEAGVHLLNGGFLATPPLEADHGSGDLEDPDEGGMIADVRDFFRDAIDDGGLFHGRLWNISFYTNPNGGPAVTSIRDPFGRVPEGFPNTDRDFFFPNLPYLSTPQPGSRIEAENFDMGERFGWVDSTLGNRAGQGDYRLTGVDLNTTADINGGMDVVQITANESLQYTFNVGVSGSHDFGFRFANDQANAVVRLSIDGVGQGAFTLPVTGNTYITRELLIQNLTAGQHRLRIEFFGNPSPNQQGIRFNHFYVRPEIPTAHLTPIPVVNGAGIESTQFTVTYRDDDAINLATIDSSDIRVERVGGGFSALATLVSRTPASNSNEVFATYRIDASGDAWDPNDRGEYQVRVTASQVRDITNNAVVSSVLGTFQVDVPYFERIPVPREIDEIDLFINATDLLDHIDFSIDDDFITILIDNVSEKFLRKEINTITLFANGGNDVLHAEAVDVPLIVFGGTGDDELFAGQANDVVRGGPGNDLLSGGLGIDTIFGDAGDDKVIVGDEKDVIDLGDGKDGLTFVGTSGHDVITVTRQVGINGPEASIVLNGVVHTVSYRNGETISVFGLSGNDLIQNVGSTTWSMEFDGGSVMTC